MLSTLRIERAPRSWRPSSRAVESKLHQLAPYIGKLKSTIAAELVATYSKPGDIVLDPFCGCGTIPLECALQGRRAIASDSSRYAVTLTRAKLTAPTAANALIRLDELITAAAARPRPDLRKVPAWVRAFFHPRTLVEIIQFADVCIEERDDFMLACLLGILHHQRPGFLSYPSSHLVPYLRTKNFPRRTFPEMYAYRDLYSRMRKKIERALNVEVDLGFSGANVQLLPIESLSLAQSVDSIITSPPYMNALDYQRDNRLRIWLLERSTAEYRAEPTDSRAALDALTRDFVRACVRSLKPGGHCVLVIGETVERKRITTHPAERFLESINASGVRFGVERIVRDIIPDIRRGRRAGQATKKELILVLRRKPSS